MYYCRVLVFVGFVYVGLQSWSLWENVCGVCGTHIIGPADNYCSSKAGIQSHSAVLGLIKGNPPMYDLGPDVSFSLNNRVQAGIMASWSICVYGGWMPTGAGVRHGRTDAVRIDKSSVSWLVAVPTLIMPPSPGWYFSYNSLQLCSSGKQPC